MGISKVNVWIREWQRKAIFKEILKEYSSFGFPFKFHNWGKHIHRKNSSLLLQIIPPVLLKLLLIYVTKISSTIQASVTQACNPSYLGGLDE
jgi:hypothetical protein